MPNATLVDKILHFRLYIQVTIIPLFPLIKNYLGNQLQGYLLNPSLYPDHINIHEM